MGSQYVSLSAVHSQEIARLLMEQEKKEYKKSKEKERQALEKRRPEGDYKVSY